jgi:hypothetical protein
MFHGPGPGRPKGLKNKATRDIQDIVDAFFKAGGGVQAVLSRFRESENEEIRFKAVTLMLSYRYGKPRETHEVNVFGLDKLAEQIAEARNRVKGE